MHDEYDAEAVEQLDRFHVIRPVRSKTSHEEARKEMLALLRADKIEELLEYIEMYCNSICTEEETPEEMAALELKEFLEKNKDRLASYKARVKEMPEAPEGIVYKNMGVQENQNCTVITLRMKGKRKRWAEKSAANMVRLLYYRENKDLYDAIERCTDGTVWVEPIVDKFKKPLSAAQVALVDGKGNNKYVDIMNVHLPILDSTNHRTVKVFKRLIY